MKPKDEKEIIADFLKHSKLYSVSLLLVMDKLYKQEILRRQIETSIDEDFN